MLSFLFLSHLALAQSQVPSSVPPAPEATVTTEAISATEIAGQVFERGTKKPLSDVNVFILPQKTKATTDKNGLFKATVSGETNIEVIINVTGYNKFQKAFNLKEGLPKQFFIEKTSYNVFETTVSDLRSKKDDSQKRLTQKEFLQAPGSNGDPVKAVQNLPGVNRTRGGDSRVIIQGSEPEDTRYNIEGHDVPLVFHFGGLSSIVTPEAVSSVDYLSAGYGPEFSRALGGHVGLNVRKPRMDRTQGMAFMDIYNIGGLVEGPISEDSSYLISGRYSYVGYVLQKVAEKSEDLNLTVAPVFFDINAQYYKKLNETDEVRVFSILSKDTAELVVKKPFGNDPKLRGNFQQSTEFYRVIPQWTRKIDSTSQVSASLGVGSNRIFADVATNYFDLKSQTLSVRGDYEKEMNPLWTTNLGVDNNYTWYDVKAKIPSTFSEGGISNPISTGDLRESSVTGKQNALGVYWRNKIKLSETSPWTLLPNARIDRYSLINETLISPRLSVRYSWDESLTLRAATGLYNQPPAEQTTDKTFGNPDIKSRKASHYALGFEKDFRAGSNQGFTLAGTLFYKNLYDLVVPSSKLIQRDGALTPENYNNNGTGTITGFEWQSKYQKDEWNFVGSYTYIQSRRKQPGQSELPSPYDQTHSLNLIAAYEEGPWTYGARARYVTGNPYTPIIGGTFDADNDVYIPQRGELYSARNDAYFQVDLRIDRRWVYDTWILSAYLDIQNLTNQKNQEGLTYSYDYSQSQKLSGLPLLPTLGVKGEF